VRLEGGSTKNPGGYQTLSIVPGPKGQNIFSLVAYTATKLPTGEMVWRDPKVITHKVTPDRATELIAHGYKGSYVHRGSLFNKRTNLLEHNPSESYKRSLEGLSPLEKSNKIASDIVYLLKESYKQRGDATLQSDTKHFLSVWGDDLTTGDKNWIKYQVSQIGGKRKNPTLPPQTEKFLDERKEGRKAMFKRGNPTNAKLLSTDENGFEYWLYGNDVYRCKAGNRRYMLSEGTPANARWECTYAHYKKYLAPKGELGNPDTTPDDPKEIAKDLRILKAKQKLVRLETGSIRNPLFSSNTEYADLFDVINPKTGGRVGPYFWGDEQGKDKSFAYAQKLANKLGTTVSIKVWELDFTTNNRKRVLETIKVKPSGRRNPGDSDSAKLLFESFHGREPEGEDDIVSFENIPDHLTELGELRELTVVLPDGSEEVTIVFPEENTSTILASAPGGTQYVLIGGDQSVDVGEFGIKETEEEQEWARKLVLGQVASLTYFTDKHHLSGPKYQKNGCLYEHKLGEEGGELPTLVYDPNNETLEIVGGSYITRAEGIRN
jgi:hypothetical protein